MHKRNECVAKPTSTHQASISLVIEKAHKMVGNIIMAWIPSYIRITREGNDTAEGSITARDGDISTSPFSRETHSITIYVCACVCVCMQVWITCVLYAQSFKSQPQEELRALAMGTSNYMHMAEIPIISPAPGS